MDIRPKTTIVIFLAFVFLAVATKHSVTSADLPNVGNNCAPKASQQHDPPSLNWSVWSEPRGSLGGTVLKGQRLLRTQPDTATTGEWIVTTSGTEGTLTGVTTSVDAGVSTTTANLSGNAIDKVYPGCYITINGAGVASANLSTRVTAVAADYSSCTIETAASTTVSGATTSYRAPVFTVYATTS